MKYDFTTIITRNGKDALAVDGVGAQGHAPEKPDCAYDFIPMWVADMNFAIAPVITAYLHKRIQHPLYGYFMPSASYYEAIKCWHQKQHNVINLRESHIGYENGVLGGVVSALEVLTSVGETVLLHAPAYTGFINTIKGCGRRIIYSPLYQDQEGIWRMNYQDMEQKIKNHHIHTIIFCSPHNPCGRVWEEEELEKAAAVFERNQCTIISDEIWSDIVFENHKHIPLQSVNPYMRNHTIALYSPSKAFNLAGLVGSYHIIYNPYLHDRMKAQAGVSHYNSMNVLSMHALIGAYSDEGIAWLHELKQILEKNIAYAYEFIHTQFWGVTCFQPEATYMLFLDCKQYCQYTGENIENLLKCGWRVGIGWQDGRPFQGENHLRINLALPYSRVVEAFHRMKKYVFSE